jgi:hypothetical protein
MGKLTTKSSAAEQPRGLTVTVILKTKPLRTLGSSMGNLWHLQLVVLYYENRNWQVDSLSKNGQ